MTKNNDFEEDDDEIEIEKEAESIILFDQKSKFHDQNPNDFENLNQNELLKIWTLL